jgi:hypothetical protein
MTKVKTVVISQHIHATSSSWSSSDVYVQIVTTSKEVDFTVEKGLDITSKNFPMLNGKIMNYIGQDNKFIGIHLSSDKTFKNGRLSDNSHEKTPEFKALVQSYIDKGFKIIDEIPEQKAYYERERIKETKRLKKSGVVLWMGYEAYQNHPECFQGGFSSEVFNSKQLKDYIGAARSVHGWIGHCQGRTKYGDKLIEAGLRKRGISPSKMFNWISSSSGRHFGDSLEDCTKAEQKEKIEEALNSMYNSCIVYGAPTHQGTSKSYVNISSLCNEIGVLLTCGIKYNRKEHLEKLILAKENISKIEESFPSPETSYIHNVINEVFANIL